MQIDISVINALGISIAITLVLLATFLLTVDSKVESANRYFAVFLLLVCFDITGLFLLEWLLENPWIDALRRGSVYLQMPFLLFYVRSICFKEASFSISTSAHFGLFVWFMCALFYEFAGLSLQQKQAFLQNSQQSEFIIFYILGETQFFLYIYLMFANLKRYKSVYSDQFSDYDKSAYLWLVQLMCVLIVAHIIASSKGLIALTGSPKTLQGMYLIVSVSALLVVCWFVLKALYHPSISRGPLSFSAAGSKGDHNSDLVKPPQLTGLMQQLDQIMEDKKPFLDPDLTLQQLAEMIRIDKKALSNVLNKGFQESFFNYVNRHRVEYAKKLLVEPANQTILDILYEVGFNSKSSFNTAFKKHAGVTPSIFRKELGL